MPGWKGPWLQPAHFDDRTVGRGDSGSKAGGIGECLMRGAGVERMRGGEGDSKQETGNEGFLGFSILIPHITYCVSCGVS